MAIVHLFHANGAANIGMHRDDKHAKLAIRWFRMGLYFRMADIECDDNDDPIEVIEQAFETSTHHKHEWWDTKPNVLKTYRERPRPSFMGDIFILEGRAFVALPDGWEEISLKDLRLEWPSLEKTGRKKPE